MHLAYSAETHIPTLEIHFDVNGTIIASDIAQGRNNESCVIQELGKETVAQWELNGLEQSYRDYIDTVSLPGDEIKNPALKRARREQHGNFLAFLERNNHPLYSKVR